MKSKKSIFVVALAALMLIAFTACEQQVPNIPLEGDNAIANIIVTEAPKFYAGSSETTGYGTITVERVGGKTTTDVTALFTVKTTDENKKVAVGTNPVEVTFGNNNTDKWMTTVDALSVESLDISYDEADLEKTFSTPYELTVTVKGVYTDGATTGTLSFGAGSLSRAFNDDRTAIVYTLSKGDYSNEDVTESVSVKTTPVDEPTVATTWKIQVLNEDGEYEDYTTSPTANNPSINYNQTKSDLLAKIRVIAVTTTTPSEGDPTEATKVLSEGTDYVTQGVAAGNLTTGGTLTVVPLVDTSDITFTEKAVTFTVVDAIDWNSLAVVWTSNPTNCKVGGTLSTATSANPDITVTLKRLSGTAVTTGYTISYIGPYSFPATDFEEGDLVSPTVKVTVGTGVTAESDVETLTQRALGPATT